MVEGPVCSFLPYGIVRFGRSGAGRKGAVYDLVEGTFGEFGGVIAEYSGGAADTASRPELLVEFAVRDVVVFDVDTALLFMAIVMGCPQRLRPLIVAVVFDAGMIDVETARITEVSALR